MKTIHNPDRFVADLRQILSQGRKRIGILVGAGAPMSVRIDKNGDVTPNGHALIPGVEELTNLVLAGIADPKHRVAAIRIKDQLGESTNIELVLSQIRLLERAIGSAKVYGLNSAGYSELAKAVCNRIGSIVGAKLPKQRNPYNEIVAWISGTVRLHPVEIFTTNYDLLFEEAFERAQVAYFDGFAGGNAPFFDPVTVAGDDLPPRWARLWKMHGSLGWALEDGSIVRGRGRAAAHLIYPDHLKYDLTQKQPYAALFERLKRFLLTPDTLLLTIGFSFRDAHVCAVLNEALAMNANAAVFAFQFSTLENEAPARKMALNHPNISVYAADGAVISTVEGEWQLGELPRNWQEIRESFWTSQTADQSSRFILGNFQYFSRFCALAQATELKNSLEPPKESTVEAAKND